MFAEPERRGSLTCPPRVHNPQRTIEKRGGRVKSELGEGGGVCAFEQPRRGQALQIVDAAPGHSHGAAVM